MKRTESGDAYKKNNPSAFEKLAKAMEMSKGKVDTVFDRELALIPNSTPEDIVRLHKDDDGNLYGNRDVWEKKEQRGEELRLQQSKEKYCYSVKETFLYRYLEKLGLAEKIVEKNGLNRSIVSKNIVVDTKHSYEDREFDPYPRCANRDFFYKVSSYQYTALIDEFKSALQVPANVREQVFKDDFLLEVWTSGDKRLCDYPYWRSGVNSEDERKRLSKDYKKKQNEKKAQELVMLANAPQNIKDTISGYIKGEKEEQEKASQRHCYRGRGYRFHTLSEIWYENTRLEPWKIEKELEIEDFYKALEYMGLGIICLQSDVPYERRNIRQFISHVNATPRQFVSDIKKGFDPAAVRAMVAEDLNLWLKERVKDKWTVFIRTDAPESYPDIEVKKRKKVTVKEQAEVVTKTSSAMLEYIKQHTTLKEN